MQDNTESEKPENFSENEEHLPNAEETTAPENSDSPDPGFEDQEGELLPPDEKKKSGAGKIFLFLILVLAGSGSYLYFNNLIPPEILNLVFPKSAPSTPPVLITQTTPFVKEVAEIAETPEPVEVVEPAIVSPAPPETPETHISGDVAEPIPSAHISGNDFDQPAIEGEEELQETAIPEEAKPVIEQEVFEEQKLTEEPATETITEPASPESDEPQRSKAAQAYLNFIESSVQKLAQLIKEGFNLAWNFINKKTP